MTGSAATLIAVLGVILGAIPIYFLARSNARENQRQRNQAVADAVKLAVDPIMSALNDTRAILRTREQRIEQLEDELRRAR